MIGSALRRLALGVLAVLAGAAATVSSAGDPRAALFLVTFAHAQRPSAADVTAMLHGSGLEVRGPDGYCGVELQGAAAALVALQLRYPERVLRVEGAWPERRPLPRCE